MIKIDDFYLVMMEAFKDGKSFIMPIKGTSMQPMLHTGDIVELVHAADIKKNDIVFYKRKDDSYVLHRVYKVYDDCLDMIGDHQIIIEQNVGKEQCFAKVISYSTNGKKKYLKGLKYKLYLFSLRFFIIRRIYIKCLK